MTNKELLDSMSYDQYDVDVKFSKSNNSVEVNFYIDGCEIYRDALHIDQTEDHEMFKNILELLKEAEEANA